MVYGVCGKLGGGKSLTSVFLIIQWLRTGNIVSTNIKINDDFIKKNNIPIGKYFYIEDFSSVNPWDLPNGDLRGSGGNVRSKIVIDEAGEWCDSYADARHKGQLSDIASWLRQSDKLGQDVYFIVQFENLLHARLRSIVHRWIICQDVDKFKMPFLGIRPPKFLRNFVIATTFDGKSNDYISRQYIYKPSVYSAYNTSAFFGESFNSNLSAEKIILPSQGNIKERYNYFSWFKIFFWLYLFRWLISFI